MDVLTDHVPILVQICLLFLIWDQELMLLHPHLQVIYPELQKDLLQAIWQVDLMDLLQVTWVPGQKDLLQVIWQVDLMDRLQAWIWMETECLRHLQVIWQVDLMDLLQVTWVLGQKDLLQVRADHLQVIWQVDQNSDQQPLLLIWDRIQWDLMDHHQAWTWMGTECRLLQVI